MKVSHLLAFGLASEVQISSPLEVGPIQELEKEPLTHSALTKTPAIELAAHVQDVRHALFAQLVHAQRGGAGEQRMYMNKVVMTGVFA